MSLGLVVVEGGVGHRTAAAQDGAARQRERRIRGPRLGHGGRGTGGPAEERGPKARGGQGAGGTEDRCGRGAERLRVLPPARVPGLPRFTGGAVGYLGYDLVLTVERLPRPPADTLDLPDAVMMIADTLVILDNLFGRAIVVANVEVPPRAGSAERLRLYDAAEARLDDMIARLRQRHELAPLALRDRKSTRLNSSHSQ